VGFLSSATRTASWSESSCVAGAWAERLATDSTVASKALIAAPHGRSHRDESAAYAPRQLLFHIRDFTGICLTSHP